MFSPNTGNQSFRYNNNRGKNPWLRTPRSCKIFDVTINTDNRTVSDTDLTKEYALFVKYFGVTTADFLTFNKNAIRASFTTEAQKADLLSKIDDLYKTFL